MRSRGGDQKGAHFPYWFVLLGALLGAPRYGGVRGRGGTLVAIIRVIGVNM